MQTRPKFKITKTESRRGFIYSFCTIKITTKACKLKAVFVPVHVIIVFPVLKMYIKNNVLYHRKIVETDRPSFSQYYIPVQSVT